MVVDFLQSLKAQIEPFVLINLAIKQPFSGADQFDKGAELLFCYFYGDVLPVSAPIADQTG